MPVKPGWSDVPPRDWGEREAQRIAIEIRERRKPRSAQWLADRTKDLGYPLSRALISDIELGRRRHVTTAELIVLAAALDTAPIMLLYPPRYSETVEALPDLLKRKIDAVQDFSGFIDEPGVAKPEYAQNTFPLARARRIAELLRNQDNLEGSSEILDGTYLADDQRERLDRTRERLAQLKADDGW